MRELCLISVVFLLARKPWILVNSAFGQGFSIKFRVVLTHRCVLDVLDESIDFLIPISVNTIYSYLLKLHLLNVKLNSNNLFL